MENSKNHFLQFNKFGIVWTFKLNLYIIFLVQIIFFRGMKMKKIFLVTLAFLVTFTGFFTSPISTFASGESTNFSESITTLEPVDLPSEENVFTTSSGSVVIFFPPTGTTLSDDHIGNILEAYDKPNDVMPLSPPEQADPCGCGVLPKQIAVQGSIQPGTSRYLVEDFYMNSVAGAEFATAFEASANEGWAWLAYGMLKKTNRWVASLGAYTVLERSKVANTVRKFTNSGKNVVIEIHREPYAQYMVISEWNRSASFTYHRNRYGYTLYNVDFSNAF